MLFCSSTHWTSHLSALQVTFDIPCCTFCVSEIPDSVLIVGLKPELMHALVAWLAWPLHVSLSRNDVFYSWFFARSYM
jgi:hypothetical protein